MSLTEFRSRYQYNPRADRIGSLNGGYVYKAYDTVAKRDVVVKVMPVKSGNRDDDFSLKEDFDALHTLPPHRNIANYDDFYNYDTDKGNFDFAIMAYYKDGNLAKQIKSGLTQPQKEQIATELLDGLAVLHDRHILHCELKPSNILTIRKPKELIPLITFGMGHSTDPRSLRYCSPEMLSGGRIKFCTDIWSYGVILYELFTGKPLFEADSETSVNELLQQMYHTNYAAKIAELPANYQEVAAQCLVVDPLYRAQNTDQVRSFLVPFVPEPETSSPVETDEPKESTEAPAASTSVPPVTENEKKTQGEVSSEGSEEAVQDKVSLFDLENAAIEVEPEISDEEDEVTPEPSAEEPKQEEEPKEQKDSETGHSPEKESIEEEKESIPISSHKIWATEQPIEAQQAPPKPVITWEVLEPEEESEKNEEPENTNQHSGLFSKLKAKDDSELPTNMDIDPFIPLNDEKSGKGKKIAIIIGVILLVVIGVILFIFKRPHSSNADETGDSTATAQNINLTLNEGEDEANEKEFPARTTPVGADGSSCGDIRDAEGNVYHTVRIGNQCWMRENLRTKVLPDGTELGRSGTHNARLKIYYPNGNGHLYNWTAATNGELKPAGKKNRRRAAEHTGPVRGICPEGWHIPSQKEWNQLTNYVSSKYAFGGNPEYTGKALASKSSWHNSDTPNAVGHNASLNNVTGFSALPAGSWCDYYLDNKEQATFWSSTPAPRGAYCMHIGFDSKKAELRTDGKDVGCSVRCIKD